MSFFEFPHTRTYDTDLGWLIKKMKDVLDTVDLQNAKIEDVEQTAEDLKEFVNNYFDNLDVQQEINNKIDQMVRDGTFYETFDDLISTVIAAWLAENITPTSPAVDSSLSVAGAAADAAAVGTKAFLYRGFPSGDEDFDNLTAQGNYGISTDVSASIANIPEAKAGQLLVFISSNILTQFYITYQNNLYIRYRTSSAWTSWKRYNISLTVSTNVDLNNYTEDGYYRFTNSAAAGSDNSPSTEGGILHVKFVDNAVIQSYHALRGTIFTRYRPSSLVWTNWQYSIDEYVDEPNENILPVSVHYKNHAMFRAHEGEKAIAPAQSYIAYELACKNGWDMVQIAVARVSADGTWWVLHDADVSLVTNGSGNIENLTDAYLSSLYVITGNNVDSYSQVERRIPKLDDVLKLCKRYGVTPSIRLGAFPSSLSTENQAIIDSFMNVIYKYDPQEIIYSGSLTQINVVKSYFKAAPVEVFYDNTTMANVNTFIDTCKLRCYRNIYFLGKWDSMTDEMIKALHKAGAMVGAYNDSTVLSDIIDMIDRGFDIIQNSSFTWNDTIQ